jgi:hypothetical protein
LYWHVTLIQEKSVSKGDGQALMLDQRFFHESVKGGFFIGTIIYCIYYGSLIDTNKRD